MKFFMILCYPLIVFGFDHSPIDTLIQHIPKLPQIDTLMQHIPKMPPIEKLTKISIQDKIQFMEISYQARKIFHTIGISQQTIIHTLEEMEWTEIDYFNTIIFISAIYSLFKNMEVKDKIEKMSKKGLIHKRKIRKNRIILFIIFTLLFRDIENAT